MNKKALKAEIIKCGTNPQYFIKNYVKIEHPVRGLIPFSLFDYQETLIDSYQEDRFNIVLKARQLGASETTAAYALWLMLFKRNKNIVVLATKKSTAKNIIRKISTAIKNLPSWLLISKLVTSNVFSLEFSNGSRIQAVSTAKDAGRSEAGSLLIIDEAAHIYNLEEIWTGLKPVVTAGGSVIILSTPKGVGNTFHKIYVGAESGLNDFKHTKLMWWVHPEHIYDENGNYDLKDDASRPGYKTSSWFRKETAGMDSKEIAQEYECSFNASGDTFIHGDSIMWLCENTIMKPTYLDPKYSNLHIWSPALERTKYFIVGDVARGDGSDYSAASVFKVSDMNQVAEYKEKIPPDIFGDFLIELGEKYDNPLIVIENNNIGYMCLSRIIEKGYDNLYFTKKGEIDEGISLSTKIPLPDDNSIVPGFTMSQKTRPLVLSKFEEYIRTRKVTPRSERFIDELQKFIWKNGRPEATKGYNDDLVMTFAIACWIHDTFFSHEYVSEEVSKQMLENISMRKTENNEIPGASKDPLYVRKGEVASRRMIQNPYDLYLPDGSVENLGWLIYSK